LSSAAALDTCFAEAGELARLIRQRELSSVELVELYLDRIERLDPTLNAYVTVDADGARAAAAGPLAGPFAGVPIAIKDLTETAGLRTTYSAKAKANHVPSFDSAVVRRIREAGFVILGKTNTPELGTLGVTESELNGICRNPWDVARTPGGSSGGAAAAVAAGLAPVAHGSDGGGSIRVPASCCGLVGLKPSRGRVSSAPWPAGIFGLATHGPIGRTLRDVAALLEVMTGYELGDEYVAPPQERPFAEEALQTPDRLRIGVAVDPPVDVPVADDCVAAVRSTADALSDLGHAVTEASPPWNGEEVSRHFLRVFRQGPATSGIDPEQLEPHNRALVADAAKTPGPELAASLQYLRTEARRFLPLWQELDVLVTPTLALPPVPTGWAFEGSEDDPRAVFERHRSFMPFTQIFNVTGQPALSLPLHWVGDVPIGVQFAARPFEEATLLRLGGELEAERPWADRRPRER
jgi:amidase